MPFTACINCPKLGNGCYGPNFFSITAIDVLEWCKSRKKEMKLTQAQLSKLSGVPLGTIAYVFGENRADFKFETIRPIIQALIGGEFHGNPCPDPNGDMAARIAELEEKNAALRRVIKENKAAYDADLERERTDADKKIAYLKNQLRVRMIFFIALAAVLFISLVVIFAALIIDRTDPSRGFFWFGQEAQAVIEQIFGYIFQHASRVISIGLK